MAEKKRTEEDQDDLVRDVIVGVTEFPSIFDPPPKKRPTPKRPVRKPSADEFVAMVNDAPKGRKRKGSS